MRKPAQHSMLWGMGILAAAWVLLELLTFRLSAAAVSRELAIFIAIVAPAAGGFAAAVASWRSASLTAPLLARRAAHLSALSGAFVALGAIGLTWASQEIARESGFGETFHVGVTVAACVLGPIFLAAAAAVAVRREAHRVGRALFALGVGGAIGALLAPVVNGTVGGARGQICLGFLAAAAAFAFGRAAGKSEETKPRWSFIATLPLVVTSLVSGDYGEPWMKVRVGPGRRSKVDHAVWTEQGIFSVSAVTKTKARLAVDRRRSVPYGQTQKNGRKPRFALSDLPYLLNTARADRGPVLVIASGAGRQIDAALAYGHPRVDAVEPDARVVNELLYDRYHGVTGGLFHDHSAVHMMVGDGRGVLATLPSDYEHITVIKQLAVDNAAPRLLTRPERLLTVEGVKELLSHVRPGGTVLVAAKQRTLPGALRTAAAALDDPAAADKHLVACRRHDNVFIIARSKAFTPANQQKLIKKCKRSKGVVEYPLEEIKKGRRDRERLMAEREVRLRELEAALPAYDDRPLLDATPALSALGSEAMAALRSLRPMPELAPTVKKGKEPKHEYHPPPGSVGVAAGAWLVSMLLLLLGLLTPTGAAKRDDGTPLLLRLSFPCFGAALAISLFALTDVLVRMLGSGVAAWSLVIPLGLVGVGGGRLLADGIADDHASLSRALYVGSGIAVVWLLAMFGAANALASMTGLGGFVHAMLSMVVLVVSGGALGFPLAIGLRIVALRDRASVGWCFAAHLAGWGAGGAAAMLLVHYLGVRNLMFVGLADFVLGGALLAVGAMRGKESVKTSLATAE